jgi:L-aspartate oxidase
MNPILNMLRGIAVALSDEDEVSLHFDDTIRAGDGLCFPDAVKVLVEEGITFITELIEWGTAFDRGGTHLSFSKEAAHSRSRVLHAHGTRQDTRSFECSSESSLNSKHQLEITLFHADLLVSEALFSAYLDEEDRKVKQIVAKRTILFQEEQGRSIPKRRILTLATGDGVAMAHRAGALMADMGIFPVSSHSLVSFRSSSIPAHRGHPRRGRLPSEY